MEASFPESYNYPSTAANNDEREQEGMTLEQRIRNGGLQWQTKQPGKLPQR